MADRDILVRKRRGSKLVCGVLGRRIVNDIEENVYPDFIDLDRYTNYVNKVLELSEEIKTFDKDDSPEKAQNIIFIETFKQETDSVIDKYLKYSKNYKEYAAKLEENDEKDDDIEICKIVKEDDYAHKMEVKKNDVKDENYKANTGNIENEVKEETDNLSENMNLEWKDLRSENEFCDVTLACDDKQSTQELVISCISESEDEIEINEEINRQNDEDIIEMDTDLYYEKYLVPEIEQALTNSGVYSDKCFIQNDIEDDVIDHYDSHSMQMFDQPGSSNSIKKEIEDAQVQYVKVEKALDQPVKKALDLHVKESPIMQVKIAPDILVKKPLYINMKKVLDLQVKRVPDLEEKKVSDLHVKKEEIFVCKQCEKRFKKQTSLKYHVKTIHVKPSHEVAVKEGILFENFNQELFVCGQCEKRFEDGKSLKSHVKNVHEQSLPKIVVKEEAISEIINEDSFVCEHCEKRFEKGKCPKSHIKAVHVEQVCWLGVFFAPADCKTMGILVSLNWPTNFPLLIIAVNYLANIANHLYAVENSFILSVNHWLLV